MTRFQRYVFLQCASATAAIFGGLCMIAFLTQALGQLDLIVEQRQTAFVFFWITLLAMPQVMALIAPLALFFGVMAALNRLQTDSEIAVAFGAGMSFWTIAAPVMRLAVLVALAHLAVTLFVQPLAFREMRAQLFQIRSDLAASMVREGAFTQPADGLTIYVRSSRPGGQLEGVVVSDSRDPDDPVIYESNAGLLTRIDDKPTLVMLDGSVQQLESDGSLSVLGFKRYAFDLSAFNEIEPELFLKPSDRWLWELFQPDMTHNWDRRFATRLYAEGHARIATPLTSLPLALFALAALMSGQFSRRGYARRMAAASAAALVVFLLMLAAPGAAADSNALNILAYALPLAAFAVGWRAFMAPAAGRGRSRDTLQPLVGAGRA